jgi:c-di-GMP-binding flagellar brake protein YcgR
MQDTELVTDNARIITTRAEIVALLRGLSGVRSATYFSFLNSAAQFSGKITQVNPYFDEIIFSEDADVDVKFSPGRESLVTVLSSVKAQFHAERVEPTEFEGKLAWRVRIPRMLYCSERRDSIRVPASTETPLEVLYPSRRGNESSKIALRVVDIGEGGLAITVNPLQLEARLGKELRNCTLSLPDVGEIDFDLVVQNTTEISEGGSTGARRCGCQFTRISLVALTHIREYIENNKL